ncbi:FG-GAP-like repeat-containing protein [Streptomyces sp. NPDC001262]|uniref:FG-GAP-like repeat-containing protein n=1 Tax=Streptomyces sp. NPDC001262 TaxID=3364552 RepID=UPI0036B752D6
MATAAPAERTSVSGRQTLRMVVHASIGGSTSRIHLVNTFSQDPVVIGHVTIAHRSAGASAEGRPMTLTFKGSRQSVIKPGESVYSDAADFPVRAEEDLLISIYLPEDVRTAPFHEYALTTSYRSADGDTADHVDDAGGGNFPEKYLNWFFLSGVDVTSPQSGGTFVAFGDSQTDGGITEVDADHRWPDAYARALHSQNRPMGVVNAGISGNRLLTSGRSPDYGPSALDRFERDVLDQPNVKSVLLYEGINDIMNDATGEDLISGIRTLAGRAHSAGLTFTVATIPPFKGSADYDPSRDQVRRQVNEYVRSTHDIDSYVDFDRSTQDPLNPDRLFSAYKARDSLHFNDNGSQALADALSGPVPPKRFTPEYSQTTAADFTSDGAADLVARDNDANLYLWKGTGDGSFGGANRLTGGWNYTQTVAGDFTGDGKADLIARDSDASLYLWRGNGDGTFSRPQKLTGDWNFTQTVAADFTGDGIADLVARDAKGDLYLWSGEPGGTFSRPVRIMGGWNYTQTVAGDFTGDGKADLIAKDRDNNLHLWPGNGHGAFGPKQLLTGGWTFSETSAGAFYGGGTAHLLARNDASGVLQEWVNKGNANFSRPLRLTDW